MRLINRTPNRATGLLLTAAPFVLVLVIYLVFSNQRLAENPDDKLLPAFATMFATIKRMASEPDLRTGDYLLWLDTQASLTRLAAALAISTTLAFAVGIGIGLIPYLGRIFGQFVAVLSMIPPLTILPIIFITVGLGETAKITLIVIGTAPALIRDMALRVEELPAEQIIKAQTLGASTWQIILRIIVPQMLPRLIDSLRLALGSAWLFLISTEAIASQEGLGYRIFLVRRYFAMDVILPYVAWITVLAFLSDRLLRWVQIAAFPWFDQARKR